MFVLTVGAPTSLTSAMHLLGALEADQLVLHYQAVVDVATGRPCAAEALVRWEHPDLGLLRPAAFLPEDMSGGLGWTLTNFVLEAAVRQCGRWWRAGRHVSVSVNIAPGRLADDVLPERIQALLERESLPASALTVEITEHRCDVDPVGIRNALVDLARLGVRLSLDDFGTGESSLSRLRQLHFDEIKIDRQFIHEVATDPTGRHIVAFVVHLAHSLGSHVVAEGVETEATLAVLADLGVDRVQGYLLHRPMPAADWEDAVPPAART